MLSWLGYSSLDGQAQGGVGNTAGPWWHLVTVVSPRALVNTLMDELDREIKGVCWCHGVGRSVDQQEGREALQRDLGQAALMGQGNEVQHHQLSGPALGSQQPYGLLHTGGAVADKVPSGEEAGDAHHCCLRAVPVPLPRPFLCSWLQSNPTAPQVLLCLSCASLAPPPLPGRTVSSQLRRSSDFHFGGFSYTTP